MPFRQGKVLFIRFFLKMGHFLPFLTAGFLNDTHGRLTIGAYSQAPVIGYKKTSREIPWRFGCLVRPAWFEHATYGFVVQELISPDFWIPRKNAQWSQHIEHASVNPNLPFTDPFVNRLWTLPLFVSLFLNLIYNYITPEYSSTEFSCVPLGLQIYALQSSLILQEWMT